MRLLNFNVALFVSIVAVFGTASISQAKEDTVIKKVLKLPAKASNAFEQPFRLLPTEQEQESGNAVPVLLRMVYEETKWMGEFNPKLREYAEMEIGDPKLHDLPFDSFANQIIRAGSMSYADWEYPLQSDRPYLILLPDVQSLRQFVGRGMTVWVKQKLAKGELDQALAGIHAQVACGRHCASTPVAVCHLVGLSIAGTGLDNLELAVQSDQCPNMYGSLAALPPTLQDIGEMIRWELWASPARLNEPLPPVGAKEWTSIAKNFIELIAEVNEERYTVTEAAQVQAKMRELAVKQLPDSLGFTDEDIEKMSNEELIMRWIYMNYCHLRSQIEPLAFDRPSSVISASMALEQQVGALLSATGAKSSPYPVKLPQAILGCRGFERRVKLLQTIEAIRDHVSKHNGTFPNSLTEIELPVPNDPFTEEPFVYETSGNTASIRQSAIEGYQATRYEYQLEIGESKGGRPLDSVRD